MKNNYTKLLILKFENAGIFSKYWKEVDGVKTSGSKDDRIYNNKNRESRTQSQWIEQTIGKFHYSFINNLVHVLTGLRPVSKYRDTCSNSNENITEISKRSLVKIDSFIDKNKDGNEIYVKEKITTRKCMDNSWNNATPSWTKMKYLLPKELYNELVIVSKEIFGADAENCLFDDVCKVLFNSKDPRVDELIQKSRVNRCEPLAKLLSGSNVHSLQQAGYQGLGAYLKTLVTKGVSDIYRLDGKIAIPLTDSELDLFRKGTGVATLFDGGFVCIDEVIDLNYTLFENCVSKYEGVEL